MVYRSVRGPFGQVGNGVDPDCLQQCRNCCGIAFDDMPDIIWIEMETPNLVPEDTIQYFPLYKIQHDPTNNLCMCTADQSALVEYQSALVSFTDQACNDNDVCCITWRLIGTCTGETCEWQIYYMNPMDAETSLGTAYTIYDLVVDETPGPCTTTSTIEEIMCGGLEGCLATAHHHAGNPCVFLAFAPTNRSRVTITATEPTSTPAAECCKMCCGFPLIVYVTISATGCDRLDGAVVELHYSAATGKEAYGGGYNDNGSHTVSWEGTMLDCVCCPIQILLTNSTWSYPDPQCKWTLKIGQTLGGPCFLESITQDDTSFCPPDLDFTGDLDGTGECSICCSGETISISAEVDF